MGERTHTTTGKSNSGAKKTWTIVIAGTAVLLLGAGVMLQVTRPTSAFPEDGSGNNKPGQPGKASVGDQNQKRMRDVARVGREHITYDELAAECVTRNGKEVLDNLINRKIIQQACDAQGIEISLPEVNKAIEKQAKDLGLTSEQLLAMSEAEKNITPTQFRRDIVWPMLALRKLAGENVKVTEDDLKKAFVRNYGERVKARAIVLDNSRRAREVWEKAQANPDDFGRLAREHSVDANSRPLDGVVPPIQRFAGSDAVEGAAFKLKDGEISPVIQVGLKHYIILKCEGRTEPHVKNISEVRDILIQELKEEKVHVAVAKVFEKLKADARVDNYFTGASTGGEKRAVGSKVGGDSGAVRQAGGSAAKSAKAVASQIPNEDDELPAAPVKAPALGKAAGKSKGRVPATAPEGN